MMKIVIAGHNKNKITELRDILSDLGVEIISQSEAGCFLEVEETGESFEENARLKANAVAEATGLPAIADDSGLVTDALDGAPGVYSARYGGLPVSGDEPRYRLLLKNMENKQLRTASFVSCVCCVFPGGYTAEARGECKGEILRAPRGGKGFGYDPVFKPDGCEKSMAELNPEEKNLISHRGKAVRDLKTKLRDYLYPPVTGESGKQTTGF